MPYTSSGFALASLVQRKTIDYQSALLSPHFLNTGLVIFIMMLIAAWVMHAAEAVPPGNDAAFPAMLSSVYWRRVWGSRMPCRAMPCHAMPCHATQRHTS